MLFNSLDFIIYFPIVFLIYWFVANKNLRKQNIFLIIASYVFYGWWDWRFLSLIIISSTADYLIGLKMDQSDNKKYRKLLLIASLGINLGFLGFFKYYNFFIESFVDLMEAMGFQANITSLQVILPVGISFYTFQTLSYSIDIYKRKISHTKDIFAFFAFVSFFPQLVAGPIERAKHLLPQFTKPREFDLQLAKDGIRQALWGFMKKIVIADNCAIAVNAIFSDYQDFNGAILVLGAFLFAFQIYCDFSGYSDIAIGTARLFGFDLMQNFNYPYFSRNISEFWKRWHISLSTWFRDYVYIPLGGSYASKARRMFNIIVTFTVSGLWHGANWTFVLWGFLNGVGYFPEIFRKNKTKKFDHIKRYGIRQYLNILATFVFILITWVFFRSPDIMTAFDYLVNIVTTPFLENSRELVSRITFDNSLKISLAFIAILLTIEWFQFNKKHPFEIETLPKTARWGLYLAVANCIILFGQFGQNDFIYFQF
ncbi:MAG: MBOAT family protein [Bacteroidetes bacterium]|jgi:D-alanyl-lipoteichoic acid acyltransferase DltB (MBOAT superfamily)|nr:MBOAT family protein [Bacteroidota bacterium]